MKHVAILSLVLILAALGQPQDLVASSDRTIEKTFPVKMGGQLELEIDTGGDIEIAGWEREEVAVTVDIGGRDAEAVEVEFDAGAASLTIHSSCDKIRHCRCNVRFIIKVPAKCDIAIDSNGGGVEIDGVEGKLSGETMGGALELSRIKGEIHLSTMGGSVTVEDSEADGKVSTMGGRVLIRNVKGNLKGSTMGGKVTYEGVSGRSAESEDEEMNVSTMGGDIEIGDTPNKVKAKTFGGDIDVAKAKEVNVTTMGGDINVEEAPAGAQVTTMGGDIDIRSVGKYVKAKTMGGDIEVGAIDGKAEATTMGGDITITMVGDPQKGDRSVDLSSMGGTIELTVPAGISAKFDIEIAYTKNNEDRYDIESDFPMEIKKTDKWEGHFGSKRKYIYGTGAVGGGEHLIKIKTINGDVILRKGS
jgi:DUF4097 and DUF4098 domain-containing protein YvlB